MWGAGVEGEGRGKEVGWSGLGDRRHHLSQQTNNVCRRNNKVVAAQQQSAFQGDRRLDGGGGREEVATAVVVGGAGGGVQETKLKSVSLGTDQQPINQVITQSQLIIIQIFRKFKFLMHDKILGNV